MNDDTGILGHFFLEKSANNYRRSFGTPGVWAIWGVMTKIPQRSSRPGCYLLVRGVKMAQKHSVIFEWPY